MSKLKNSFGETVEQCAARLLRTTKSYKKAIRAAKHARDSMLNGRPFYVAVISHLEAKQR